MSGRLLRQDGAFPRNGCDKDSGLPKDMMLPFVPGEEHLVCYCFSAGRRVAAAPPERVPASVN
jgi:hypothetical protein